MMHDVEHDPNTTAATPNGDRAKGTVARDPEVVAIVKITALIEGLTGAGRDRVLLYLADKYHIGDVGA